MGSATGWPAEVRSAGWLRRPGLRGRVTLGFGLLALALSLLLSVTVWLLVSHYLIHQREATAVAQCSADVVALQANLDSPPTSVPTALDRLPLADRTASVVRYDGAWFSTSLTIGRQSLPSHLLASSLEDGAVSQRFVLSGAIYLAVAIPMRRAGDVYIEIYPMSQVEHTVRLLTLVLVLAAAGTAAVGLVVGRLASRLALRPLAELTAVAARVARGDRDVRLEASHDPDLDELAGLFNHTAAALEQRVAADARFAGDVSHQLRTPLTTMLNSMELLRNRRAELPESAREPLDLLDGDLAGFRRLVVDLLEISKDDSGAPVLLEPVNIADLVQAAADASIGRTVRVLGGGRELVVMTDKRRLEQVVRNLVENAELHGGGCLQVLVSATTDAIRIEVDDAGPGVPEAQRERLFERFVRGPRSTGTGTGLGLAIVARHARSLGGTAHVVGRPGGGARFVVGLPRDGGQRKVPR